MTIIYGILKKKKKSVILNRQPIPLKKWFFIEQGTTTTGVWFLVTNDVNTTNWSESLKQNNNF